MKNCQWLLFIILFSVSSTSISASASDMFYGFTCRDAVDLEGDAETCDDNKPQGWSFDLGAQYTWMSFTTPPTYTGSTGGVNGKITYQTPKEFFGQLRTIYNTGGFSSSLNSSHDYEWYSEFVGGYCFPATKNWSITPYVGLGVDFMHDSHSSFSSFSSIGLGYTTYYALFGFDTHYTWENWMLGLQVDCFPTFNQYLRIKTLTDAAWVLGQRTGGAVRIPAAYRLVGNFWLELTPYYRFMPIGASHVLRLPHRNLNEWGGFATFRYFL